MPKNPDYSKSLIYKLCSKNPEITEIYIGSTTNKRNRKNCHRTDCNNSNAKGYNRYVYQFIRDNGGFENWDLVMIEDFQCNSKNELECRERYWIETLKPELNKQIPTRTKKESFKIYYEEHKEELNKKHKKWCEENKEELNKYYKKYYEKNKDKIKEYREKNKEVIKNKKKEIYEKNKEKISKKSKEYREKSKDKIKKYYEEHKEELSIKRKEKIKCEKCGYMIQKYGLKKHQKTMKCLMMSECLFSDEDD